MYNLLLLSHLDLEAVLVVERVQEVHHAAVAPAADPADPGQPAGGGGVL